MNVCLLIVDDEEQIRQMLSRHFRLMGFDVLTAFDGQNAIEVIESNKVDIVISDILMPNQSGIDLLRHIKENRQLIHVIMISGYVCLENALTCMRLGAQTIIFKPIEEMIELEDAVNTAVNHIQHWFDVLKNLQSRKPGMVGHESR
jgi:DNA-binding NtrC family response regulator